MAPIVACCAENSQNRQAGPSDCLPEIGKMFPGLLLEVHPPSSLPLGLARVLLGFCAVRTPARACY